MSLNTQILFHTQSAGLKLLFFRSVLAFPVLLRLFLGGIDAAWLCGLNSEQAERMREETEVKPGDVDVCGTVVNINLLLQVSHHVRAQ